MSMVSGELSRKSCFLASLALLAVCTVSALAQDTGSISGKVLSAKGVAISDAKILMINTSTGQTSVASTDPNGNFTSPALAPASYEIRVEAKLFISARKIVAVAAGAPTSAEVRLDPEPLPGIVAAGNIELLPTNGRNFLQYPELEPGVLNGDAGAIDPGKNGVLALSLDESYGRLTRTQVDGLDHIDETAGMTTQNVPASAIGEIQLGRLMGPLPDQMSATGDVNMVTRGGSNDLHGDLFGTYRNGDALSAKLPGGGSDWGRQQFGGRVGGALSKDKAFFFLDAERNRQDLAAPVLVAGPFIGLVPSSGSTLREPFREFETADRLDYKLSENSSLFYRFGYDQGRDLRPFGSGPSLQPYLTRTNVPSHTFGADFTSGNFVQSLRFEYLKFRNVASNASGGVVGGANPDPNVTINIGGGSISECNPGSLFCSGPNYDALRQTYQSTSQFRYDGSRVRGNHIFHVGGSFDRIRAAQFAPLYGLAPTLSDQGSVQVPASAGVSGLATDPLSYPVQWAILGNGRGLATEKSALGLPGGGASDNEFNLYAGDTWKALPGVTLTYGVRWVRDTGRSDNDLAAISQLNSWGPKLGGRVRQPNLNFAPQLGVAWDPGQAGKTVFRAGAGLFYDTSLFANEFLDRSLRMPQGSFQSSPVVCVGGAPGRIQWPTALTPGTLVGSGAGIVNSDGTVSPYDAGNAIAKTWCGESIGVAGPLAVALQQAFQAATAANTGSNPNFIGGSGAFAGPYQNGLSLLAPNFQTPRTLHFNAGLQHELRPGLMFTVDYVRDVTIRTLLGVDVNHGGASSTFNANNALIARDAAQVANSCPAGPGQVGCMVAKLGPSGALAAYGAAGIGGPAQVTGGAPCPFCAFPGVNPALGVNVMNFPAGRSVYTGIDVGLKQHISSLTVPGLVRTTFQASYSRSRNASQVADTSLANLATDYANPDRFIGPDALDRKHQISVGAFFELKHSFQASFISHIYSPLPVTLKFQQQAGGAEVLVTDWNGDGTTGDVIPGSNVGSYMRTIRSSGLKRFIGIYNASIAGSSAPVTPAGVALINGGVFSVPELAQMGGTLQPLASTVTDVSGLGWLKTFDVRLGWEHKLGERITITPSVSFFNALNFANFDAPGNTQNGILNFGAGSLSPFGTALQPQNSVGGTSPAGLTARTNRTSLQSGMSAAGAPRSAEWGLKISF